MFSQMEEFEVQLVSDQGSTPWEKVQLSEKWYKTYAVGQVTLANLTPGTQYFARIRTAVGDTLCENGLKTRSAEKSDDFSFLIGSCAFKGVGSDKLAEPRGHDFRIFDAMSEKSSDFMLWTGDNVYYLKGEWNSKSKMARKNGGVRLDPQLNRFLGTREQYAIWDDHDFGPNNSDGTFKNKTESLEMFGQFWPNPAAGTEDLPGVFFKFSFGDADFFMMDDRYHRIDDGFKQMWGPEQLEWLREGLSQSTATFKFVVSGNQILNDIGGHETQFNFKEEQKAFFEILRKDKIEGVVFLTGDRHFTELLTSQPEGMYPLYDFTCSPLTSWIRKVAGRDEESEKENRVAGTQVVGYNFGKVAISGPQNDRKITISVFDKAGIQLWEKEIRRNELNFPE